MHLHGALHQGEAQAEPTLRAVERGICLREGLEDVRQDLRAIPRPVSRTHTIASRRCELPSTDTLVLAPRGVNLTAFWSRFPITCERRVRSPFTQISAGAPCISGSTPLSTKTARWSSTVRRVSLVEVEKLAVELGFPAGDPRDVEQIVDEAGQAPDLAIDDELRPAGLLAAWRHAIQDVEAVANGASGFRSSWESIAGNSS